MNDLVGEYSGKVIGWSGIILNRIWKGKYFRYNTVLNKIFGRWMIKGNVYYHTDSVVINYPKLHIKDTLRRIDDTRWSGEMNLLGITIRFELTPND